MQLALACLRREFESSVAWTTLETIRTTSGFCGQAWCPGEATIHSPPHTRLQNIITFPHRAARL